jgi:predicted transcriptional regulator
MADTQRRAAGELETGVLGALWAADRPLTAAEVNDRLSGDLARTTVVTILSRLYDKGLLTRHRVGRGYAYRPVDERATRTASQMRSLLDHDPDRTAALSRFISDLAPDEERLVLRLLAGDGDR